MPVPTWVTEMGILGTWVVGVLALFGDRIRAWWFRPKLHLELKSDVGSYSPQIERDKNGTEVTRHARYYHLSVTNRARYPKAEDVQVLLLGVERINDDQERRPGDLYVPLTLGWVSGIYPLARSIGSKTEGVVDLLYVRDDVLRFLPVVVPHNFQRDYSGKTHLRVSAVARGLDCESNVCRLTINWDGEWVRDDNAMKMHFRISPDLAEA
jgi:hypothetical protein